VQVVGERGEIAAPLETIKSACLEFLNTLRIGAAMGSDIPGNGVFLQVLRLSLPRILDAWNLGFEGFGTNLRCYVQSGAMMM
jgi:hypothetical protein